MLGTKLLLASIALGLVSGSALPTPTLSPLQARANGFGPNCNSPENRQCWRTPSPAEPTGFNVDTDAEDVWPTGVEQGATTTTYTLIVSEQTMTPDGTPKLMQVINGTYPGPVISANWGDTVVVYVNNQLKNNGTSMHWHGVVQANTTGSDGVNGITECPIEPNATRRYEWVASQHGTSWYHSHYSGQYGDGVLGTILIHGPATVNYDEDLGTFPISDLYQNNMWLTGLAAERGGPPRAKGATINGTMKNAAGGGAYANVVIEQGKKYRLRLVNTAVDAGWKVSLDNHIFQVIKSDFVSMADFNTTWLFIGIGQRYDVVFTANQTDGRYLFRVEVPTGNCANNALSNPGTGDHKIFAIFTYKNAISFPEPTLTKSGSPYLKVCLEEQGLAPWLNKSISRSEFTFVPDKTDELNLKQTTRPLPNNINSWLINDHEIDVEWDNPTLEYVANNTVAEIKEKNGSNIYEMPEKNKFYFWVIQNANGGLPHPIHLHGHDFYILGTGSGVYNETRRSELNFDNPLRRDVVMLPPSGFLVIAIYTDNPGVWLMHCHIAWHVSMGLGVQFIEREDEIRSTMKPQLDYMQQTCNSWTDWYATSQFKKPDSGLRRLS